MLKRRGFTLVEVMVAAVIFAVGLLGLFGIGRMMHRSSITNVADGVALHAVEGLMEQLRVLPYETVLLPAAQDPKGSWTVPVRRYQGANSTKGTPGRMVEQLVPVNPVEGGAEKYSTYTDAAGKSHRFVVFDKRGYTTLEGVNLSTSLDKNYAVIEEQPMKVRVKILMHEVKDLNFVTGVTIEVFYEYQSARPEAPDSNNFMGGIQRCSVRTFIPRNIT